MAYCTNCGKESSAKRVCEHCGVKKNKKHNFCQWCGTELDRKAKTCPNCGEPKKAISFLGKVFQRFFGGFFIFYGLLYMMQSFLPALLVLLVGVLLLPSAQMAFRKATHSNLKLRKIINLIATPVLAVVLFLSMNTCLTVSQYETAVEHWDNGAYAAAMNYFSKIPDYKDSDEYIEKFESEVIASLVENPWCSGMEHCDTITKLNTRWDYAFDEDGNVLRREQLWERQSHGGYVMVSYKDYELPYTLIYDTNEETGVYEARILIGSEGAQREYVLYLGINEDDEIVVIGFVGDMLVYDQSPSGQYNHVTRLVEQNFSRDSNLPELD